MTDHSCDSTLPIHIGIIMDGNGRWATAKNMIRSMGHKEGLAAAKRVVKAAADMGIKYLTLYMFSTENWKRTVDEVGYIMSLLRGHLRQEFNFYKENHIRIHHIGDISGLPDDIQKDLISAQKETAAFDGLEVSLAINYGGRNEIARAVAKVLHDKGETFSESDISEALDTAGIPDPDLIIRTGGEQRLSNFLTWQSAYSELYFSDILWPDCDAKFLENAINEFKKRNRRFGGV